MLNDEIKKNKISRNKIHKKDQYWFGLKFHTHDPNLETKITAKKKEINEAQ
jgi:hypothetical protein